MMAGLGLGDLDPEFGRNDSAALSGTEVRHYRVRKCGQVSAVRQGIRVGRSEKRWDLGTARSHSQRDSRTPLTWQMDFDVRRSLNDGYQHH